MESLCGHISSDNTSTPASLMLHLVILALKSPSFTFLSVLLILIFYTKYVNSDSEIFTGFANRELAIIIKLHFSRDLFIN